MPSLRQRMTTYLRQLSFVHEPRGDESPRLNHLGKLHQRSGHASTSAAGAAAAAPSQSSQAPPPPGSGCFVTQYLEGRLPATTTTTTTTSNNEATAPGTTTLGPTTILHGKEPTDLPELPLLRQPAADQPVTAACTGPDAGLCGVRRSRLHLSAGPEIDFIDTAQDDGADDGVLTVRPSTQPTAPPTPAAGSTDSARRPSAGYRRPMPVAKAKPPVLALASDSNANERLGGAGQTPTPKNVTINIVVNTVRPDANSAACNNNSAAKPDADAAAAVATVAGPVFAAVPNWRLENDHAYGLSVSLYEQHYVSKERVGDPIADCFGLVVRGQSAVMAMADGVNWGDGARLAARSAVHGCLEYLDTAIFGRCAAAIDRARGATTRDVFVSLLRSFWEAHSCILEVGGALSTLTACVVLPLAGGDQRFVVCACNVGDSFGYVYSKRDGVREFTQGSHDIATMRDMRDALGALGPVQGNQPELGNLTLSLTLVEPGDIVFLTSDGISDNFDPVVGRFAEAQPHVTGDDAEPVGPPPQQPPQQLAPKRQNRSTSAIPGTTGDTTRKSMRSGGQQRPHLVTQRSESSAHAAGRPKPPRPSSASTAAAILSPQRTVHVKAPTSPPPPAPASSTGRPKFLRSHTVIEPRSATARKIAARLPLVSGAQRHALTLLRLEDLLCYGINGTRHPCPSARKLCHLLVDFARMITAARRGMLEQRDLYYRPVVDPVTRARSEVELNRLQQRAARKRVIDGGPYAQLPGKLDHASVVAFTVERLAAPAASATATATLADPVETDF